MKNERVIFCVDSTLSKRNQAITGYVGIIRVSSQTGILACVQHIHAWIPFFDLLVILSKGERLLALTIVGTAIF